VLLNPDLSTHSYAVLTEINFGSKPLLSHVVQRFSRMLSYVLVSCSPVSRRQLTPVLDKPAFHEFPKDFNNKFVVPNFSSVANKKVALSALGEILLRKVVKKVVKKVDNAKITSIATI
jgi:hypothetical protein